MRFSTSQRQKKSQIHRLALKVAKLPEGPPNRYLRGAFAPPADVDRALTTVKFPSSSGSVLQVIQGIRGEGHEGSIPSMCPVCQIIAAWGACMYNQKGIDGTRETVL